MLVIMMAKMACRNALLMLAKANSNRPGGLYRQHEHKQNQNGATNHDLNYKARIPPCWKAFDKCGEKAQHSEH
ncbi:hypothetical protein [Methylobacillus glycogenes]|uniref:hypothetical protein n=1 Tax=Methylobacillus glycogenes TaxID=406 RepID=UPI0011DD0D99|nr:hypothetical protein [Methylobacillus glycogenes]